MKKAVFLDRDGTIIEEKNYLSRVEDIVLLENAVEGLKLLQDNGYMLFIISNQSGVARGYFSEETVIKTNKFLEEMLQKNGIFIKEMYYCPHFKDGIVEEYKIDCNCRKPKIGMIQRALDIYDIDLEKSFIIGDKLSDMQLAKNCNSKSVLVLTGHGKKQEIDDKDLNVKIAEDLLMASKLILED